MARSHQPNSGTSNGTSNGTVKPPAPRPTSIRPVMPDAAPKQTPLSPSALPSPWPVQRIASPSPDVAGSLRCAASVEHELTLSFQELELKVAQQNPAMTSTIAEFTHRVREVLMTALATALWAERRRLTWLLHNDLASTLDVARERLKSSALATSDAAARQAMREVESCIAAAAKVTRGLMTELDPTVGRNPTPPEAAPSE